MTCARLLWVFVVASGCCVAIADQASEQAKVTDKYEVVSFGKTQSLKGNLLRSAEGCGEYFGFDLDNESVYKKRFDELKLHYDDARKKFKAAGVDWKKEPINFGMIDWNTYTTSLGVKHWEDHRIQFYVAARKRTAEADTVVVFIEHNDTRRNLDFSNKEQDAFQVYLEQEPTKKYQRWRLPSNWKSGEPIAIENVHQQYLLDYNDKAGPVWSAWDCYIESPGPKPNKYQRWKIVDIGNGLVLIQNAHSGRVLDYHGKGDHQWRVYLENQDGDKGNKHQRWRIIPE